MREGKGDFSLFVSSFVACFLPLLHVRQQERGHFSRLSPPFAGNRRDTLSRRNCFDVTATTVQAVSSRPETECRVMKERREIVTRRIHWAKSRWAISRRNGCAREHPDSARDKSLHSRSQERMTMDQRRWVLLTMVRKAAGNSLLFPALLLLVLVTHNGETWQSSSASDCSPAVPLPRGGRGP